MRRVVLHIDRLVLRGIPQAGAPAFSAGLRAELQSILGSDPSVDALSNRDDPRPVRAGTVRVPHGAAAGAVGRAVAGRIVRGATS